MEVPAYIMCIKAPACGVFASRDPEAKMLSLQSFLRKGVSLGYVGQNENLKDLKAREKATALLPSVSLRRQTNARKLDA